MRTKKYLSKKVESLIEIGDWCITRDHTWGPPDGIYADHIIGCSSDAVDTGDSPVEIGDCCWAGDDNGSVCFYCKQPVPPEIQALVLLQTTL